MVQTESIGYLDLLRENRNFRYLWLGQIVSLFGDWFNLIASAALISNLTDSGLAVGGLFIVRMLAPFFVSPIAGVAADRFNRKQLLIITDITRAMVVLGFLFVRDADDIWLLYALTAVQMAISGFFFPTRNAILPDVVDNKELGAANALGSATWSIMLALGAAMGGIVAGGWGIYPAFVIDSATFILSALILAGIHYSPTIDLKKAGGNLLSALNQYTEGLRYLVQNKDVLIISLQKGAIALAVSGGFQIIQVILTEKVYVIGGGGGISLGIMYAVAGVGTGIGPIVTRRFTGDQSHLLRIAIGVAYLICIIGLLIIAPLWGFVAVLLGSFLRAIATGINWVFSTQLLLQIVPSKIRGRVFSTEFAFFTLANAIGTAASGWILDNTMVGLSGLIFIMVLITVIPGIFWGWWNVMERKKKESVSGI
jgi:MFS family permease